MTLRRLPIRARLAAALAVAMSVVLVLTGAFVYVRLASDLNRAIDDGLRSRADDVAALVAQADSGLAEGGSLRLADSEEAFSQVLSADGRVLDSTPGASRPALDAAEIGQLTGPTILDDRQVAGIEGAARLLATPVTAQDSDLVVVVGSSTNDLREALDGLVRALALGGPVAVLVTAALGYLLAGLGLAPVEAMRRRAEQVTLARSGERLPLPAAEDEIHRLGETLNAMLARLEAAFERERAFVADASHELRTPLAVLRAELEVTLRGQGYDEAVGRSLATALEEVDHLSRVADDLLLIARSQDGDLALKPEATGMRELIRSVVERFRAAAEAQGRAIVLGRGEEIEAEVDPLRIRQAVGNLVDNALRYGEGEVGVELRGVPGGVTISVSDAGPGFPDGFAERAFERFTRADPGRARGGSGLGLAIVQAIANAHGGTATIADAAGRGARVVLTIPRTPRG